MSTKYKRKESKEEEGRSKQIKGGGIYIIINRSTRKQP